MRIAVTSVGPDVDDPSPDFAVQLATGLAGAGADVVLAAPGLQSSTASAPGVVSQLDVRKVPKVEGLLGWRLVEQRVGHLPFAASELANGGYDVVCATSPQDGVLATVWAQRTALPTVFALGALPRVEYLRGRRWRLWMTENAIAGCAATTVTSAFAAAMLERTLGLEARVVHPGVDLVDLDAVQRAAAPTVAVPADAAPEVLAAVERVLRERPDVVVTHAPDDGAWVRVIAPRPVAFDVDVVAALGAGAVVVADATGSAREIATDDSATLCAVWNAEAISTAILEALEQAASSASVDACRGRAEAFSVARNGAAYTALIQELS